MYELVEDLEESVEFRGAEGAAGGLHLLFLIKLMISDNGLGG